MRCFHTCTLIVFLCVTGFGQRSSPVLIRDVRVFDGKRVIEHRSVVIRDGKIGQLADTKLSMPEAEVINGQGRTLLPGLFDAHVHVAEDTTGSLRQTVSLGVTTVFDMCNAGERLKRMKRMQAEDSPNVASLRTAGGCATVPGGHGTEMGGPRLPTITKPEQAQAFVDARIAEGSDYIKIIYDDNTQFGQSQRMPTLDKATLRALVDAAHKRNKLAVAHILSEQQARDAIDAGVDGLVHLFVGDTARSDFGQFAASHHIFVIPTLTTLKMVCGKSVGRSLLTDPHLRPYIDNEWRQRLPVPVDPSRNHFCQATDDAIRQLIAAQVPILTGTDSARCRVTHMVHRYTQNWHCSFRRD